MDNDANQKIQIAEAEANKIGANLVTIIRKDEDMQLATEQLATIKRTYKNIDAQKKEILKPQKEAVKRINELFDKPLKQLKALEDDLKVAMVRYNDQVERRAAKRADKIESQVDSGDLDMAGGMQKLNNVKQADKKVDAEAGSAGFKILTKYRIVDPSKIPAGYFIRDKVIDALLIEIKKDIKDGKPVPEGVEEYKEKVVAVTTK